MGGRGQGAVVVKGLGSRDRSRRGRSEEVIEVKGFCWSTGGWGHGGLGSRGYTIKLLLPLVTGISPVFNNYNDRTFTACRKIHVRYIRH